MGKTSLEHTSAAIFHTLAFATRKAAQHAYEDFIGLGVSPGDISLFVHAHPPAERGQDTALDHDVDIGGALGAGVSTLAGGAGGLLTGLGVLAVPGLGPLLAVGPV
ncbi:MAG TPA: hypothetical protein VFQ52_03475, partial [Rhizomicrobium sp.]|nr:hypothetical protein [Rhizomicrobium sp.]